MLTPNLPPWAGMGTGQRTAHCHRPENRSGSTHQHPGKTCVICL